MKHNFKKIMSLLLTVVMLLGTMSALIPFSASAEEDYVEITPNDDFTHNGITYRFDVQDGNTESYAHILADGSVEFKLADGDVMWFPKVLATDDSTIHAEVTAVARTTAANSGGMGNLFAGLVYGYNGTTEKGVGAIVKTAKRYRVANLTRSNLAGYNGGDGYGNGGDSPRLTDTSATSAADVFTSNSSDWAFGKTVSFDISRDSTKVYVVMSGAGGEFANTSYTATSGYSYAGAVGFASVWCGKDENRYGTFRFDKLTLTNCTVNGEAKDTYTVLEKAEAEQPPVDNPTGPSEVIYLEKNKTATIGGVTYRFDVANPDDENVWARINTDGTWEVSIRNGDMLWFPGVEATADSVIYGEYTNTMTAPINLSSGIAYGVKSNGEGYTTGSTAVMRTGKRIRVTPFSPNGLYGYNGSDGYGNGGDSPRYLDNKYLTENAAYNAIKNSVNGNWDGGKTVYFKISSADGNANVEMGAPGVGSFYNGTYSLSTYPAGAIAGGSVGFVVSYQAGESTLTQIRYDNITITNCNVNGQLKDTYTVTPVFEAEPEVPTGPSEVIYLEKNKTATIGGVTYRFDVANPDDENVWARINTDGTWEVSIRNGDMLWFPGVEATADSVIYAEFTNTMNAPINLSSGIAYGVKSAGDTYTTGSSAVMRTGRRIRVTPISPNGLFGYNGSDGYGNGGDSPRYLDNKYLTENDAYNAIKNSVNGNWDGKKTVYFQISPANDGVKVDMGAPGKGSFYNSTYSLSSYPAGAIAGGSVGFVVSYQAGAAELTQIRYDKITLTNCNVNGQFKDTYTVTPVFEAEPTAKNAQVSLTLDGTIGLNFAFNAAYLSENATVVVTKNGEEILTQDVVNGENVVTAPVNAKEMNDAVNFSIMVDGELFDEHSYTTSVKEYADAMLASNDYADWHDLIRAMLNYGAAAQQVKDYKTDALVADISGVNYDFSNIGSLSVSGNTSNLAGLFATLTMESDTALNLYFKTKNGEALTFTVNDDEVAATTTEDGFIRLSIADIAADQLADEFVIIVNGGEIEITISATQWAKTVVNSDESAEMKTLAMALAAYADAAKKK